MQLKVCFFTKYPLNYYLLKVTKFHDDRVKNESARIKNYRVGAPNAHRPACLGLIIQFDIYPIQRVKPFCKIIKFSSITLFSFYINDIDIIQ